MQEEDTLPAAPILDNSAEEKEREDRMLAEMEERRKVELAIAAEQDAALAAVKAACDAEREALAEEKDEEE